MVDWVEIADDLGAWLKIQRTAEAYYEQSHRVDNANFSKRLLSGVLSVSVPEEQASLQKGWADLESGPVGQARSAWTSQKASFEAGLFPLLDVKLPVPPADQFGAFQYLYTQPGNGQVSILNRTGRLGALYRSMLSAVQHVKPNVITVTTAFAANPGNVGKLVKTSITYKEHALTGIVTFTVTDDTVGATVLSITNLLRISVPLGGLNDLPDGTTSIAMDSQIPGLRVGQSCEDGPTGVTALLALDAITEVSDPGAIWTLPIVTTPTESDSNKGRYYRLVTRQASDTWLIQWFRDAAGTSLVASTTTTGVAGTVVITLQGSSGTILTGTFDKAAANTQMPGVGNTALNIIDINSPRLGDTWTEEITNDEAGNFQTKIAHMYRFSLPSNAVPTFTDSKAASVSML
jgi:hypothetical protein